MSERKAPVTADFDFRKRLAKIMDGNRVSYCYQCGACVGDCPSARYDEEFNPRRIMLEALYGLSDRLTGDESVLWRCSNCYTCAERCPQLVKPVEVIIAIKNMMLEEEEKAPESAGIVTDAVRETGRSTKLTSTVGRRREGLGLPALEEPPVQEIRALCGLRHPIERPHAERSVRASEEAGTRYAFFPGCMIPVKYPQMEAAIRRSLPRLGVEVVDLPDFACCPDPIYFKAADKMLWLTLAARNLAVAEEAGLEIFTICSGCTATLSEAVHHLGDPDLRRQVNARLERVGREYRGEVKIRHLVTILRDEVGLDRVAASVTTPFDGVKVAAHYGCHLLKPREVMRVDDPDDPTVLDDLLDVLGVEVVRHRDRLICCGRSCQDCELPKDMLGDLLDSAMDAGAECLGVICPTCFDEFDMGQIQLARERGRERTLPAVYFFQLLALAQGDAPKDVGLDRHRVKPAALLRS